MVYTLVVVPHKLPVWRSVLCQVVSSPEAGESKEMINQLLTLVCANGFTFLVPLPQFSLHTLMQLPQ